jgi:hypothetical protein
VSHISAFKLSLFATIFVVFGFAAQSANAANLLVDDDGVQCPAAAYTSVQSAINAAVAGDTVVVCEGTYSEGSGAEGTNALTIDKSIDIRGEGADKVTIQPTRSDPLGGQIAAATPELRDNVGNIVSVAGTPEAPITVNISGVTVSGGGDKVYFDPNIPQPIWNGEFEHGVYAEAGVVFLDAGGSFNRSRVTNVVTSETPDAEAQPGGYRSNDLGWALAQVSAATAAPVSASIPLDVIGSRFDRYNKGGILIDGATGNPQEATVITSSIVGRNLNSPPLDGSGGGRLLLDGTVFGQDGVQVTEGSSLDLSYSDIFQNLMAGAGTYTVAERPNAAGVRLIDAAPSVVENSNLNTNSYGIINVTADGTTANAAVPVDATNNFWGITNAPDSANTGPDVSPSTLPPAPTAPPNPPPNPLPVEVSPVNGEPDGTFGSDAVHFEPYRSGNEADSDGKWPTSEAPLPVADAAPTVTLQSDVSEVDPGGTVTLTADASDDFGITKLVFYQGDEVLDTLTPPANQVSWDAPIDCGMPQNVGFTVAATDSSGQTTYSDVTSVAVDDCGPEVSLTAADNGTPLGSIKLSADASDDLGLAKIEFYVDGELVHTATNPTSGVTDYVYTPADPCGGGEDYSFEAVATDTSGHEASATTDYQREDCAPSVTLESDQAEVDPGGSVTLTATAEDDDLVTSLSYQAGSTSIGTSTNTDSDNPWVDSKNWTAPDECGTSTLLSVTATDSADQTGTATVTVTTTACPDNPPSVSLAADPTSVDPGGQVTLTATATDDDAVSSITFFEGSNQIGQVTPPADSITWTAPEACDTAYTLKAVARDSADQTAEDTVTVTTRECPVPADPTVNLDSPPAKIAQKGTVVRATATGEAGLEKVTFFLGTRKVCTDTTAPYSCRIVPKGSEIGKSSIRAVVTDALGRTAEDSAATRVAKFKPKNLTLRAKRIGRKKVRMKVHGRLVLPPRISARNGCADSRIDVKARLGKRSLTNRQVRMRGCTYSVAFAAPRTRKRQRVVISVRFPGNDSLTATRRARKVR